MAASWQGKHKNRAPSLKSNQLRSSYLSYASLSFRMLAIMGVAAWVGGSLDKYFQLHFPVFLALLAVGAIVLSIYFLIRGLTSKSEEQQA